MNQVSPAFQFLAPFQVETGEFRHLMDLIAKDSSKRDLERTHPWDMLALLRRSGLGAMRLPIEEGGGGASVRDVMSVAIRLGEADTNVAQIYRNHFVFVERCLVGHKGDKKRQRWRQAVLDGQISSLAATELDRKQTGGASPFSTILSKDGSQHRLNGTKFYTTGALYSQLLFVRASRPDNTGVSVVIPTDREGVEMIDDWDGMGQRVTGSGTTKFNNVLIEDGDIIKEEDSPPLKLPYSSSVAQLFITAINAGIIRAVLRDATSLLRSRDRTFYYAPTEKAIDDPILLEAIGRISCDANAAELVVLAAADVLDRTALALECGQDAEALVQQSALVAAKAKVTTDELAIRSATALFDVGGASAAMRSKDLDRHWRNARTLASHNPASYKAAAIGGVETNGTKLPMFGFF